MTLPKRRCEGVPGNSAATAIAEPPAAETKKEIVKETAKEKEATESIDGLKVKVTDKKPCEVTFSVQVSTDRMEESVEDAIIQKPLAAVGLAIGLGFLIGVTWRR